MLSKYLYKKVFTSVPLYYFRTEKYSSLGTRVNNYRSMVLNAVLSRTLHFDLPDLRDIQNKFLQNLLFLAAETFFWKEIYEKQGVNYATISPPDLDRLPVLTKYIIATRNLTEFFSPALDRRRDYVISTSGTTGERLKFLHDRCSIITWRSFFKRSLSVVGFSDYNRVLILNFLRSWTGGVGIHIQLDESTFQDFFSVLQNYSPGGIFASSDLLVAISREFYRTDRRFKLGGILYNGRLLLKGEKELVKLVFGAELFSLYGTSECGLIAFECGAHNGLHINMERIYFEIIDGRVIVTVLDNLVMPLIRYDVGDRGAIDSSPCPCSIKTPRLFLEGRARDVILVPPAAEARAGSLNIINELQIPFSQLGDLISSDLEIEYFHVTQKEDYTLEIGIAPTPSFAKQNEENLRERLDRYCHQNNLSFVLKRILPPPVSFSPDKKIKFFSGLVT